MAAAVVSVAVSGVAVGETGAEEEQEEEVAEVATREL